MPNSVKPATIWHSRPRTATVRERSPRLLAILLAAGALVFAQDTPPSDNPAGIDGTVTNAITGEPLLRAHVTLVGNMARVFGALTNAEGKFSITGLPAGSYSARVEKTGFSYTNDRNGRFGVQIAVQPGDRKNLELKLAPAGAIGGRVVDAEGEPVEGVSVNAETNGPGMRVAATTDDKGEFRLGGLAPGKYRIRAMPQTVPVPPEIRTDGTVEVYNIATYYPNAADEKGATRVAVAPGTEVSAVEIRLLRAPILRVSGRVIGMPAGCEHPMLEFRKGRGFGGMRQVRPDATFLVWRLEPGKYAASAVCQGNGRMLRSAPVEIELATANLDNLELRMVPPSDIPGQVEFEDERAKQPPQPPGSRQPARTFPPLQLILYADAAQPPRPAAVAGDGSFRLLEVQPGAYRVKPSWPGIYVKSMRLGQTAMDGNLLDLRGGAVPGAALSLLVASASGEISGVVTDDKGPAAHVPLALIAADDADWMTPLFLTTGDDGSYRITGVAPGSYRMAAVDDTHGVPARSILEDYEDVLVSVELHEGDKITQDLKRHPAPGK